MIHLFLLPAFPRLFATCIFVGYLRQEKDKQAVIDQHVAEEGK